MDNKQFVKQAKEEIKEFLKALGTTVDDNDIFVVWYAKTLQNHKALLSSTISNHYFECTYNGDKQEMYVDVYTKEMQLVSPYSEDK